MRYLNKFLMVAVMCLMGFSVFADEAKIGIVDLQKIMQTSTQMKAIQQKLEAQFKPRRDKLLEMETGMKSDMEKFKRDSAIMSQADKKVLERKIVATQQRFELEGQQYQQELSTAHNEAMEELYTKIRQAIAKVADSEHFDLVLQKDAAPFSISKLDLTEKIIKEIK